MVITWLLVYNTVCQVDIDKQVPHNENLL